MAAGYDSWWDWLRERDWLWGTADAIDGAIAAVRTLRARGHYLEMLTSKPRWAEPQVWRWLGKWRPAFHRATIIDSSKRERKVDATDADVMVDDKFKTCEEFVEAGRRAILFDPGNVHRQRVVGTGIAHAASWSEVLEIIEIWEEVEDALED